MAKTEITLPELQRPSGEYKLKIQNGLNHQLGRFWKAVADGNIEMCNDALLNMADALHELRLVFSVAWLEEFQARQQRREQAKQAASADEGSREE